MVILVCCGTLNHWQKNLVILKSLKLNNLVPSQTNSLTTTPLLVFLMLKAKKGDSSGVLLLSGGYLTRLQFRRVCPSVPFNGFHVWSRFVLSPRAKVTEEYSFNHDAKNNYNDIYTRSLHQHFNNFMEVVYFT